MDAYPIQNCSQLTRTSFILFSKLLLIQRFLSKGNHIHIMELNEFLPGESDISHLDPWWLIRIDPAVIVLKSEKLLSGAKNIVIRTYATAVMDEDEEFWINKCMFEGRVSDFQALQLLENKFPALQSRQKCFKAIEAFTDSLEVMIKNFDKGIFSVNYPGSGVGFYIPSGFMVDFLVLESIIERTLEKILFTYELLLQENHKTVRISRIQQLDGYINSRKFDPDAVTMTPDIGDVFRNYNFGVHFQNDGNNQKAMEFFEKILEYVPSFIAPRINLASSYLATGQVQKAIDTLNSAYLYAPEDPDIFIAVGRIYDMQGLKQEEINAYFQAVQRDPEHLRAAINLGITFREVNDSKSAEKWFENAINIIKKKECNGMPVDENQKLSAYFDLIQLYINNSKWNPALQAVQECIKIQPNNSQFRGIQKYILSQL